MAARAGESSFNLVGKNDLTGAFRRGRP
jgi:hypothetical protein